MVRPSEIGAINSSLRPRNVRRIPRDEFVACCASVSSKRALRSLRVVCVCARDRRCTSLFLVIFFLGGVPMFIGSRLDHPYSSVPWFSRSNRANDRSFGFPVFRLRCAWLRILRFFSLFVHACERRSPGVQSSCSRSSHTLWVHPPPFVLRLSPR